jgi:hypothetical protein
MHVHLLETRLETQHATHPARAKLELQSQHNDCVHTTSLRNSSSLRSVSAYVLLKTLLPGMVSRGAKCGKDGIHAGQVDSEC